MSYIIDKAIISSIHKEIQEVKSDIKKLKGKALIEKQEYLEQLKTALRQQKSDFIKNYDLEKSIENEFDKEIKKNVLVDWFLEMQQVYPQYEKLTVKQLIKVAESVGCKVVV